MAKINFRKTLKHLYAPSRSTFSVVDVPEMQFLMVDGQGDPNTSEDYQAAVEALYAVAYGVKFALKADPATEDYTVPPLEGLWWTPDMAEFILTDKAAWHWTMMIMQPDWATQLAVDDAKLKAARKKPLQALDLVRLAAYHEGPAAQILYVGAYDDEAPTIAALHTFIHEEGYLLKGKHHEVYLSDPRRTSPERLRTVIRQPFALPAPN
jgi:hypothetical protein